MKVSELTGALLDDWVAKALGYHGLSSVPEELCGTWYAGECDGGVRDWEPSVNWAQGGPLMEKYKLSPYILADDRWAIAGVDWFVSGDTLLEAICRAAVRTKFGGDVSDSSA